MQPEYLIARAHSLLETAPRVELGNFGRPCVSAFNARDERLADVELGCDFLLHPAFSNAGKHGCVPRVQFVHALALASNDVECGIGLCGLDREIGARREQEPLDIGGGRNGVAVEPPIAALDPAFVFFNAPVAEPLVDRVECGSVSVGEPQSDAALVLVDFNAAFPVEEASDVAKKGIVAEMVHPYALAHIRVSKQLKEQMAVPVMRWIGERIAAVEALAQRAEAA